MKGAEDSLVINSSLTLDLKNHFTAYIQPSYNLGNGLAVFGKIGYSHADLEISTSNLSNSGTLNKKDDLEVLSELDGQNKYL